MHHLLQEVRFAARALAKRPGFSLVAVLTLALGIGATTTIFSVVSGILLRDLPYDSPERIVQVWNPFSNEPGVTRGHSPLASLDIADIREAVAGFERLAEYERPGSITLTEGGTAERIRAAKLSADVFTVLGTPAQLGRTFTPEEDAPGGNAVAVLSHAFWQRRFGGQASALGSSIRLDGTAHTIVGVMPASFRLPDDFGMSEQTAVLTPLALDRQELDRSVGWLHAIARLRLGVSVSSVNAALDALTQRWIEQGFKISDLPPYYAVPIEEEIVGNVRPSLWVLFGAVAFVLLIACVNVANLLLARADGRRTEMALRAALGAGRWRIITHQLAEGSLLAIAGGAVGLLLAYLAVYSLVVLNPSGLPRLDGVAIDAGVFGFAVLVALVTGVLAGLAPALQTSRLDVGAQLKAGSRSVSGGRQRQRFRSVLVAAEVALSLALVIGATLMIRTFVEMASIDLGFRDDRVLTFGVSLPSVEYPDSEQRVAFYRRLIEELGAQPGIRSAGAVAALPLASRLGGGSVQPEGAEPLREGDSWPNARWQAVIPGYFETMDYDLTAGRFFEPPDRIDAMPVALVNETMEGMLWPGRSALGQRIRYPSDSAVWFTVVGVVRDVRQSGIVADPSPTMFVPYEQYPMLRGSAPANMSVAVRTGTDPSALATAVRTIVAQIDPAIPVSNVRTMDRIVSDALARPRFTMLLLGVFGAVALALAITGIYGVLSYAVSQRRREIGIRVALGATRRMVLRLIMGEGLRLALVGIGVGLVVALLLTRTMESLVYGIRAVDPATFVLVPVLFAIVALAASYLPARRAAGVDAAVAFRQE